MTPPKLQWMTPMAPSCQYCYLLDKLHFRVGTQQESTKFVHPEDTKVELWTNLYHKETVAQAAVQKSGPSSRRTRVYSCVVRRWVFKEADMENNEGEWHAVPMKYLSTQSKRDNATVVFFYGVDLVITCLGCYSFTYRLHYKNDTEYTWASWITVDGHVEVRTPICELTTWILEPETAQITHNIYIGNYTAALEAPERGFDCIINMADNAPVYPQQLSNYIIFKKFPIPTGSDYVISDDLVRDSVEWLRAMSDRCKQVMLVSRNGRGRSGSIMISFIFAMNPDLSFEEAYKFVDDRHFVYHNKGLRDTLYRLYPRNISTYIVSESSTDINE